MIQCGADERRRRGLDRAEPLFSPIPGRKCKRVPGERNLLCKRNWLRQRNCLRQFSGRKPFCNTPEHICHPERLEKIEDFRKESKDLRNNFTANVPSVRRSFDSLRSLRMTELGSAVKFGRAGSLSDFNWDFFHAIVKCIDFMGEKHYNDNV